MKQLVVVRMYPEKHPTKPGLEEIVGPINIDSPLALVEFVDRNCKNDEGSCGYKIEGIDTEQM